MSNTGNFLADISDGLTVRLRGENGKGRLRFLDAFLPQWVRFQRKARHKVLHYVDLQAGPGKIKFSPGNQVLRSSALIALTALPRFDQFWFAEPYRQERSALDLRIRTSSQRETVNVLTGDAAAAAGKVVEAVEALSDTQKPLYLVYLDQDNFNYAWETVSALAQLPAVNFLVDFSGVRFVPPNTMNIMFDKAQQDKLDAFFGDGSWRQAYRPVARDGEKAVHEALVAAYQDRLATIGQISTQSYAASADSKSPYLILATSATPFPEGLSEAVQRELQQPRLF